MVRLFIGAGRDAGVRPQDLVGAIANEAGIPSKLIGSIDIADRFSLVEVDENVAQDVIYALRDAFIKGRQCVVRYDREGSPKSYPSKKEGKDSEKPSRKGKGNKESIQMSNTSIRLIVGLGNIGDAIKAQDIMQDFILLMKLLMSTGTISGGSEIFGDVAKARIGGVEVILLKPSTLMNLSGKAVAAVSAFYKITPSEILVAHDELDLLPGTARLKIGGGSAGHNGLKSIVSCLAAPTLFV